MKRKTSITNHIPIKQVWLKENIIFIKNVQICVDQKMFFVIYQRIEVQKLGSSKNEIAKQS
jgi:hypothetical protein